MKEIHKIIKQVDGELEGAGEYIQCAATAKASGDTDTAAEYAKMADAELAHALGLQAMAAKKVARVKANMPQEASTAITMMTEMWEDFNRRFVMRYGAHKNSLEQVKK